MCTPSHPLQEYIARTTRRSDKPFGGIQVKYSSLKTPYVLSKVSLCSRVTSVNSHPSQDVRMGCSCLLPSHSTPKNGISVLDRQSHSQRSSVKKIKVRSFMESEHSIRLIHMPERSFCQHAQCDAVW